MSSLEDRSQDRRMRINFGALDTAQIQLVEAQLALIEQIDRVATALEGIEKDIRGYINWANR